MTSSLNQTRSICLRRRTRPWSVDDDDDDHWLTARAQAQCDVVALSAPPFVAMLVDAFEVRRVRCRSLAHNVVDCCQFALVASRRVAADLAPPLPPPPPNGGADEGESGAPLESTSGIDLNAARASLVALGDSAACQLLIDMSTLLWLRVRRRAPLLRCD